MINKILRDCLTGCRLRCRGSQLESPMAGGDCSALRPGQESSVGPPYNDLEEWSVQCQCNPLYNKILRTPVTACFYSERSLRGTLYTDPNTTFQRRRATLLAQRSTPYFLPCATPLDQHWQR